MPKRSSNKRPDEDDPNVTAFNVVQQATAEDEPETAPAKNPAAVTAVIVGVLVILWMTFSPTWTGPLARWRSPFDGFLIIVIGTLSILLVGLLVGRIHGSLQPPAPPAER